MMKEDVVRVPWPVEPEFNQPAAPRYLYKYRPVGEFTNKILRDQELWYSRPQNFNDPFDCQLHINGRSTVEQLTEFFKNQDPDTPRSERRRQVKELFKTPHVITTIVNQAATAIMSTCGVTCLAERPDDILMWSHYSNSHSGLCLKFDLLADEPTFSRALKVKYSDKYPEINFYGDLVKAVHQLTSTKALRWEYEQEWRLVKNQESGAHKFQREALVEVIFGCRASEQTVKEVKQLLSDAGMHHVSLARAKVNKSRFAVDIVPL